MTHLLLIKGSIDDARETLLTRGIPTYAIRQGEGAAYATAYGIHEPDLTLSRWMNEQPYDAPYPPGTLLWYHELAPGARALTPIGPR